MQIPDPAIRHDALSSLTRKRGHTDGAALFTIIPRRRNPALLRLLVAYEMVCDFLDGVSERGAYAGQANGRRLHLAMIDALDHTRPICDYYLYHPWRGDGGYLRTFVEVCREGCARLASYERVRPLVVREATRAQVLAINHDPDPASRDTSLRNWADREFPPDEEAAWFELTGAASATLVFHVLFALAVEPTVTDTDLTQTHDAYFPWISAATTMLDSYVDQVEDAANGDHSYLAHYPTPKLAMLGIGRLVKRSMTSAHALKDGERHAVIVASMIAMYLSKDSARTKTTRVQTRRLVRAGGSLPRLLLPILRLWRTAYSQRSST
jgi:tetraprenyl-beta-curcumene synthase